MTNYEKIKNMTLEEMARFFCNSGVNPGSRCSDHRCSKFDHSFCETLVNPFREYLNSEAKS